MRTYLIFCLAVWSFLGSNTIVSASESLRWSGFMTIGARYSDKDKGFRPEDQDDINWREDSKIGLNLSGDVSQNTYAAAQFVASLDDGDGRTFPKADWAFLGWDPVPEVSLRFGRIKLPIFLHSEYQDVGHAFTTATLPYLYNAYPLKSVDGFSIGYSNFFGSLGLVFDLYAGTISKDFGGGTMAYAKKQRGTRLALKSDYGTLQLAYTTSNWDLERFQWEQRPRSQYAAAIETKISDFGLTLEYTAGKDGKKDETKKTLEGLRTQEAALNQQIAQISSQLATDPSNTALQEQLASLGKAVGALQFPILLNEAYITESDQYYALLTYNVSETVVPYLFYEVLENSSKYSLFDVSKTFAAIGVKYFFQPTASFKFEVSEIKRDGDDYTGITDPNPFTRLGDLGEDLTSHQVKTSVNVIF